MYIVYIKSARFIFFGYFTSKSLCTYNDKRFLFKSINGNIKCAKLLNDLNFKVSSTKTGQSKVVVIGKCKIIYTAHNALSRMCESSCVRYKTQ